MQIKQSIQWLSTITLLLALIGCGSGENLVPDLSQFNCSPSDFRALKKTVLQGAQYDRGKYVKKGNLHAPKGTERTLYFAAIRLNHLIYAKCSKKTLERALPKNRRRPTYLEQKGPTVIKKTLKLGDDGRNDVPYSYEDPYANTVHVGGPIVQLGIRAMEYGNKKRGRSYSVAIILKEANKGLDAFIRHAAPTVERRIDPLGSLQPNTDDLFLKRARAAGW